MATGFAVLPTAIARDGSIEPALKCILLALSSFAGTDQSAWPTNKTLCECTGLGERTVRDWLREAEIRGLLITTRRFDQSGSPLANLYRLNFDKWGEIGFSNSSDARQILPGVPADFAGGEGRHSAPPGAVQTPTWGAGLPPNKTIEQNQPTKPEKHIAALPLVAVDAPTTKGRAKPSDESWQIIAAYNAICLSLARCEGKPGSAAAKAAAAAWRREPDLAVWRARFARAEASDFLTGRRGDFKADCLWLLNPTNVEKLDAGRYDPRNGSRDPLQAAIAESTRRSQIADAERRANPIPESADEMPF